MNKYEWIPTECAPENYPVRVYDGNFFYGDNKKIYIPNGRLVNYGWGETGSINIAGEEMKEAPDRLEITWISFTENITYTGQFKLDREKIDSLFKKGYGVAVEDQKHKTFDKLKVGMAPGGFVVVWISGGARQVEVGSFQAHATTNVNWKRELPDMKISMEEYVAHRVAALPVEIQEQVKNRTIPFDPWKNWRKRYNWHAVINEECRPETLFTEYFNEEQTLNAANGKVDPEISELAVPKRMYIFWTNKKNESMRTDFNYDEQEVTAAFAEIKDHAELNISVNPEDYEVLIKLKSNNKEIILNKTKTKTVLR
ncbi:DUF2931 family protein [Pedobacter sp. PAMC26386]|nr:DUF2931 family protein [Pedobacter sp. PAMC26386]